MKQLDMLTGLPERQGDKPRTGPEVPHEQLSQNAPPAQQDSLWDRMTDLPGVVSRPSGISTSSRALHLVSEHAGPITAFLTGREFAHLHQPHDGSLHLTLPFAAATRAIAAGWAEHHPLARRGVMPPSLVMVFGPRDNDELETIWHIVRLSHSYAAGLASTRVEID